MLIYWLPCSQPPQLLNCVPVIDTNQIEAGDIFTFYVNHTNEYVSKNIPVDSFGRKFYSFFNLWAKMIPFYTLILQGIILKPWQK